jgi:diguanylate cyclase
LRTVAEGVETPEQLAFLRDNGCDLSQGYLHSRPCSATALRDLLRAAPRDQT